MIINTKTSDIERLLTSDPSEMVELSKNVSSYDNFFDLVLKALGLWDSLSDDRELIYEVEKTVKREIEYFNERVIKSAFVYLETRDEGVLNEVLGSFATIEGVMDDQNAASQIKYIHTDSECDDETKHALEIANTFIGFFKNSGLSDIYTRFARIKVEPEGNPASSKFLFDAVRWNVLSMIILACAESDYSFQEVQFCLGMALSNYECSFEVRQRELSGTSAGTRRTDLTDIIHKVLKQIGDEALEVRPTQVFSIIARLNLMYMGERVQVLESESGKVVKYDGNEYSKAAVTKAASRILKKRDTKGH